MEPVNRIYLTFEINAEESVFDFLGNIKKLNMGPLLTKYNFSILNHTEQQKLEFIIKEICDQKEDLLLGYAFKLTEELAFIIKGLNKNNLIIRAIFIPSPGRIVQRKVKSMNDAKLYGRWIGTSVPEMEQQYIEFGNIIEKIKSICLENEIKAIEC